MFLEVPPKHFSSQSAHSIKYRPLFANNLSYLFFGLHDIFLMCYGAFTLRHFSAYFMAEAGLLVS